MSNYTNATNETPKYIGNLFADIEKSDGGLPHAMGASHFQVTRANRSHPELSDDFGYTYNHAPDMTFWNGYFWVQYLSNRIDEHEPGGISFISRSKDGKDWEKPIVSFPKLLLPHGENLCDDGTVVKIPENEYAVMHQRTAFYIAPNGKLLTTGFYGYSPNHAVPWEKNGLGRVVREIYKDGSFGPIYFIYVMRSSGWKEETLPYPVYAESDDKEFVCACEALLNDKFETQQWAEEHGNDCELISLKTQNEVFGGKANKPYQAFARYHIDEQTVVALWKQAIVGISKDNGENWSIKREPSFATSGAKAWGQKTDDGKFAITYVNSLSSEHRYPLVCVTSENGIDFDGMVSVFGETPPRRYDGLFKDFGPQYVRGISENCKDRPDDAIWLTYSVNKEDIWVSRIPVPVKAYCDDYFRGNFDGKYLDPWNTYSSKWAYVENKDGIMVLTDKDPLDYALAELNFPPCEKFRAEIEIQCENYSEDLHIELTDTSGRVCARLFISNGKLSARYTSVRNDLCSIDNDWHKISVEQDCLTCDYTVFFDGKKVGVLRNMQKVNEVSRLIIRTKPQRKAPGVDVRPIMPDIPNSDLPTEPRIYNIRYVSTEKL